MSTLYVALGEIVYGIIGVWRDKNQLIKVMEEYPAIKYAILEYKSDDANSNQIWIIPSICSQMCPLMVSDSLEKIKEYYTQLQNINLTYDDVLEYWNMDIGKIRNEETIIAANLIHKNYGCC